MKRTNVAINDVIKRIEANCHPNACVIVMATITNAITG